MKKYFYYLSILLVLILCACNNDDIIIETAAGSQTVSYKVLTQPLYEQFGIEEIIRDSYLRPGTNEVVVYTYVYDSTGTLVESIVSSDSAFNNVTVDFELPMGEYTIVSIESLDNDSGRFNYYWEIEGEDQLSTLIINQRRSNVYWQAALGVCYKDVIVGSSSQYITATPEAIGGLIDVTFYNFANSSYENMGIGSYGRTDYYQLNPQLPEEARFVVELTNIGKFKLRGSIERNDEKKSVAITLFILEDEFEWFICTQNAYNVSASTWNPQDAQRMKIQSGSRTYIGVYLRKDGDPFQMCVGTYDEVNSWSKELEGETEQYPYILDWYLHWGASVSEVQNNMSEWTMMKGSIGVAAESGDHYVIGYEGWGRMNGDLYYWFKTETSDLYGLGMSYSDHLAPLSTLLEEFKSHYTFLKERYLGEDLYEDEYWFEDKDTNSYLRLYRMTYMNCTFLQIRDASRYELPE